MIISRKALIALVLLLNALIFGWAYQRESAAKHQNLKLQEKQLLAMPLEDAGASFGLALGDLAMLAKHHEVLAYLDGERELPAVLVHDLKTLVQVKPAYRELTLTRLSKPDFRFSTLSGVGPIPAYWQQMLSGANFQALAHSSRQNPEYFVVQEQAPGQGAARFVVGVALSGQDPSRNSLLMLHLDLAASNSLSRLAGFPWAGHVDLLNGQGESVLTLGSTQKVHHDHPHQWQRILTQAKSRVESFEDAEGLFTFKRVDLLSGFSSQELLRFSEADAFVWYLILHLPPEVFEQQTHGLARWITFLFVLVSALAVFAIWLWDYLGRRYQFKNDQLRQYHDNLLATVQSVGEGIVLCTEAGKIEFVNLEAERIFGAHAADLKAKSMESLFVDAKVWADAPAGLWVRLEGRRLGGSLPLEIRWEGFDDGFGGSLKAVAIRDLSDRLAYQAALIKSRQQLEQAQQIAAFGYWTFDPLKETFFWSTEVYHLLGYSAQKNQPGLDDFVSGMLAQDREMLAATFKRGAQEPFQFQEDYKFRRPNGTRVVLRCQGKFTHQEGLWIGTEGTLQDITDLSDALDRLRASEQRYRRLLDLAPVPVVVQIRGRVRYANQAFAGLVEASTVNDLIGVDFLNFTQPQAHHGLIKCFESVRQGQRTEPELVKVVTLNHQTRLCEVIGMPVEFAGEEAIQTIILDITEREESKRAAEESASKYKGLFVNAPDLIFLVDHQSGQILDCNPATTRQLDFSRDELLEKNIFELDRGVPQLSSADLEAKCRELGNYSFETRILTRAGTLLDFEVTSSLVRYGDSFAFMSISRNITERKRAMELLMANEERFKLFYQQAPIAYQSLNAEGVIVEVNPAYCEMLGYPRSDLLGKWFGELLDDENRALFNERFERFKRAGHIDGVEFRCRRADGKEILAELNGRIVYNLQGQFQQTQCVLYDITAHRELEKALEEAKLAAEQASRTKSEFLANMSHEIRTPMNGVLAMAQHLATTSLDEDQSESVELLGQSAKNLLVVINDILDLSKIEAGKIELVEEPFDLRHHVQRQAELFRHDVNDRGLELILNLDETLAPAYLGDVYRIGQVLNNFLSNAIKFTEAGQIRLSVLVDGDHIVFEVSDTGQGIPLERQEAIFKPFEQLDSSTSRRFGGTGLGLAISHRLVDLMGGEISLHSQEGQGATFSFWLPLKALNQLEQRGEKGPQGPPDLSGHCLLLVEDNRVNQKVALKILKKTQIQIILANNGAEALELLRQESVDVVLMDVQMPVMDGLEATQQIRSGAAGERAAQLPILALTAFALAGDRQKCLEAGMDGFLSKPFDAGDLYRHLAELLGA
ncbi:MAG: PAS domain S-box protein [bacterium]|nr:PAS domain S-box protein [bacterium]